MSGRLIITSKKTYTPWSAANIERFLQDERIEKEKVAKQNLEIRKEKNKERIVAMKKRKHGDSHGYVDIQINPDGKNDHAKPNPLHQDQSHASNGYQERQHVNLFETEEKQMVLASVSMKVNAEDKNKTGIMPVFLSKKSEVEFEAHSHTFYKRKTILGKEVDDRVKHRMDPMCKFHEQDDLEKCNEPRRKKSREISDNAENDDSSGTSASSKQKNRYHKKNRRDKGRQKKSKKSRRQQSSLERDDSKPTTMEKMRMRLLKRREKEEIRERKIPR